MSEKQRPQFRNVRLLDGNETSDVVRGWNVENSRKQRETEIASQAIAPTPENPLTIWRKMLVGGAAVLAVAGFVASRNSAETPKPTEIISVTAEAGDSPWSIASRYNDESVNIVPLADQISHEPQVRDGLQPGETVQVPVVKPPHK